MAIISTKLVLLVGGVMEVTSGLVSLPICIISEPFNISTFMNLYSQFQIVKSNESQEKMWYSAWYVQLVSLFITPIYMIIKVHELAQFIKAVHAMMLGVLIDAFIFTVSLFKYLCF